MIPLCPPDEGVPPGFPPKATFPLRNEEDGAGRFDSMSLSTSNFRFVHSLLPVGWAPGVLRNSVGYNQSAAAMDAVALTVPSVARRSPFNQMAGVPLARPRHSEPSRALWLTLYSACPRVSHLSRARGLEAESYGAARMGALPTLLPPGSPSRPPAAAYLCTHTDSHVYFYIYLCTLQAEPTPVFPSNQHRRAPAGWRLWGLRETEARLPWSSHSADTGSTPLSATGRTATATLPL